MSLTEERKRELLAGLDSVSPPAESDEAALARLNAQAEAEGQPTVTLEEFNAARNVGKPLPEPTAEEKVTHVGAKYAGGVLDVPDLPYNIEQMSEAVGGWVDKKAPGVRERYNQVMGVLPGGKLLFDASTAAGWVGDKLGVSQEDNVVSNLLEGRVKATETVPGLVQAREWAKRNTLSDKQLEQAPYTKALGTGASYVGVPGVGTLATALKHGSKALPGALAQFGREVGVASTVAAGAGVGSLAGEFAGGNSTAGELIGAGTALIAALRYGKPAGLDSAQRDMLDALMARFENKEEAIAAVQRAVDNNEVGTLLDLTGSQNIADVESLLARFTQPAARLREKADARASQIYDETVGESGLQGGIPYRVDENAAVTTARQTTDRRVEDIKIEQERLLDVEEAELARLGDMERAKTKQAIDAADERLAASNAADEAAVKAREDLTPELRPDQYSTSAAGKYAGEANRVKKEVVKPAWKAFTDGPDIPSMPLKLVVKNFIDAIEEKAGPVAAREFIDINKKNIHMIRDWGPAVRPQGIQDVIGRMKAQVASVETAGPDEKRLKELYELMEKKLAQPDVSPEYTKAVAASKAWFDRFDPGYIGDIRKAAEPEEMLSQFGLTGDRGAATARLMVEGEVPGLMDDVANYLKAQAVRKGTLTDAFTKEYEAVLDALPPQTRDDILSTIQAEDASKTALARAKAAQEESNRVGSASDAEQGRLSLAVEKARRDKADTEEGLINAARETNTAKYGKSTAEADNVVEDILTKRDGPERLAQLRRDLMDQDAALGVTTNMDSFKTRVNRHIVEKLFDIAENSPNATRQARGDAIETFRSLKNRLTDQDLLTPEQATYIDEVLSRLSTEKIRKASRATVAEGIQDAGNEATNLKASAFSAMLLAPLPGGYNLQLGGAVRRYFKEGLEAAPTKRNIDALAEYMTNPKAFLKGIEKLDSPAARDKFFLTKLVGAAQAAAILGGE